MANEMEWRQLMGYLEVALSVIEYEKLESLEAYNVHQFDSKVSFQLPSILIGS